MRNKTLKVFMMAFVVILGIVALLYMVGAAYFGYVTSKPARERGQEMKKYALMTSDKILQLLNDGNPQYPKWLAIKELDGRFDSRVAVPLMKKLELKAKQGSGCTDVGDLVILSKYKVEEALPHIVKCVHDNSMFGREIDFINMLLNYDRPKLSSALEVMRKNVLSSQKTESRKKIILTEIDNVVESWRENSDN